MDVFHYFKILQMVPNRAKHHILWTLSETYWSILKSLASGTKIPFILSLLRNNIKLIEWFFNQEHTAVDHQSSILENISCGTKKILPKFEISKNDIVKFIRYLDPNEPYGHDEISK